MGANATHLVSQAADMCGWQRRTMSNAGPYWRSPDRSAFIHAELLDSRMQKSGIDALALQLWRLWWEQYIVREYSEISDLEMLQVLRIDSLQAIEFMINDMTVRHDND